MNHFEKIWNNKKDYVILDTETTGFGESDRIVEIGITDVDGNVLLDTLVYTDVEISPAASNVNGIYNKDLEGKPTIEELTPQIDEILRDKIVLIYNADFDTRMLVQSGYKKAFKSECLMKHYMNYIYSKRWVKLAVAMERNGINIEQNHRAADDCICCAKLIEKIANK